MSSAAVLTTLAISYQKLGDLWRVGVSTSLYRSKGPTNSFPTVYCSVNVLSRRSECVGAVTEN